MRYFLNFIFLLLAIPIAFAQMPGGGGSTSIVGKITGTVIDSVSGDPVEFATVVLHQSGSDAVVDGTISDELGNWGLRNVKAGVYNINISFIVYTVKYVIN